jgi:hypothetical protein
MQIRVIDIPIGPAPEHVRKAWIGQVVRLLPGFERPTVRLAVTPARPASIFGWLLALVTGRIKIRRGYVVDASAAVEQLAKIAPEAAAWWRESWPEAVAPGMGLLINVAVCQEIHGDEGV